MLVWWWARACVCSHCCPTLRTHNLRKLCSLNHLLPAALPSWDGTEWTKTSWGRRDPLWARRKVTCDLLEDVHQGDLAVLTLSPTTLHAHPDTSTHLTEGQIPYHHEILHRKWRHSCLAAWTASSLIFQVWAVSVSGRNKWVTQIIPNCPYKVCTPMNTDMHMYQQHRRLVTPSGCMALIHNIPPYIYPFPLTLSSPCLSLLVMEADLGVPVPVIFHPRQKKLPVVSGKVVTAPDLRLPFPTQECRAWDLLGNQPSHRWERPPTLMCAHHMGHFIYIAGSTHLYLVCLRGHHGIRKLKMKMEYNVWKLRGGYEWKLRRLEVTLGLAWLCDHECWSLLLWEKRTRNSGHLWI